MQTILKKVFGSKSDREIKTLLPIVDEINQITETLASKSEVELLSRAQEIRKEIILVRESAEQELQEKNLPEKELKKLLQKTEQGTLDEYMPEAFAIVKETCRHLMGHSWKMTGQTTEWNMIPYDVQIAGAIILHRGKITEMKTGEGKTLVATMPIFLNALTGRGVHIITVNDYLAQRDAEWMGEVYKKLGLTVGYLQNSMDNNQRREAYNCDITYGTNTEYGFDYLRDNMSLATEDQVQRGHAFAVVDEVDSVLIDEARTPLIISGSVDAPVDNTFQDLKPLIQNLVRKQNSLVSEFVKQAESYLKENKEQDAGLKLLQANRGMPKNRQFRKIFQESGMIKLAHNVESSYLRDKQMHKVDEDLYFSIDEKSHIIDITEKGRQLLAPNNPETFVIPDLGELLNDIDSQIDLTPNQIAKEKEKAHQLHAERSGKIHNINQLLRAYTLYEKDVEYVIQDGKVMIVDEFTGRVLPGRRYSEGLHQALEAKENVTIERETQTLATITIQNYFRLYDKLSGMTGTAETEAEEFGAIYNLDVTVVPTHTSVIREDRDDLVYKTKREKYNAVIEEISNCHKRGQPVLVGTISVEVSELLSRMLKRKGILHNVLNAKQHQKEAEIVTRAGQSGAITIATNMAGRGTDIKLGSGVKEVSGLHILGTERHDSRRIDLQLRGRSGRQGDPGSSQFYLSLEDDLMRLFGSDRIAGIMDKMGVEEGEVITAKMVTRAISNAQKKVEGRNYGIRKHLLEYDDVMNQQRQVIYDIRNQALHGEDMKETVLEFIEEYVADELESQDSTNPEDWNWESIKQNIASHLLVDADPDSMKSELNKDDLSIDDVRDFIIEKTKNVYAARESLVPEEIMRGFERFVVLRTIDEKWKDHLYSMDQIREGINLRAYGQKDPLLEYKSEGFNLFQIMMGELNKTTVQRLLRTQLQGMEQAPQMRGQQVRNVQTQHKDTTGMGFAGQTRARQANQPDKPARTPIHIEKKIGRNEKITMVSPSGKKVMIKHKKLQQYLNQGYTEV
ncbi:MAG TPA: preprotein translocase subunit SecA [Candidatus Marinimicrobia bacterium]|nr:preprotein translocase subunit SecA [Candidatus Neomarinimicrobiota bacterium]